MTKIKLHVIILFFSMTALCQNSEIGPEVIQPKKKKVNPKLDPKKEYKSINFNFSTLEKRIQYMRSHIPDYCINGKVYNGQVEPVLYNAELAMVDLNHSSFGSIVTVKMSENSVFVFMFHYLCNFSEELSGKVSITYFNYTFGEVDKKSIRSKILSKTRVFPKNNVFTEELVFGSMRFQFIESYRVKSVFFSDKSIELDSNWPLWPSP